MEPRPPSHDDLPTFVDRLGRLDGDGIEALAGSLRAAVASAEGEIQWWRATVSLDAALRRHHRTRDAGLAAHDAAAAVVAAAHDAGFDEDDWADVNVVARAAAEAARALVAADDGAADSPLLAPWGELLAPVAAPA